MVKFFYEGGILFVIFRQVHKDFRHVKKFSLESRTLSSRKKNVSRIKLFKDSNLIWRNNFSFKLFQKIKIYAS